MKRKKLDWKVTEAGCFEVISHASDNTGYIKAMKDRQRVKAHRFIYEECFGAIPEGLCVLHKCDNRKCINPEHLFLGTKADNNTDRASKGRSARGERVPNAKLTELDIRVIRDTKGQLSQKELAAIYGVDPSAISRVISGENWSHI